MPNPVVHFEILGSNAERLRGFYSDAFGWSIDSNNPMNYGLVEGEASGIGGGIGQRDEKLATFYIEVDDPRAYLDKVESLGGKTVQDVTVIPGAVTMALFEDPAGNVIGLVKASALLLWIHYLIDLPHPDIRSTECVKKFSWPILIYGNRHNLLAVQSECLNGGYDIRHGVSSNVVSEVFQRVLTKVSADNGAVVCDPEEDRPTVGVPEGA